MRFDWTHQPGLIHGCERESLKSLAEKVVKEFGPKVNIVNIGVACGASVFCLRAGAPKANLYGVDINAIFPYLMATPEAIKDLNLITIIGDSKKTWVDFDKPIHLIFVDGNHNYGTVASDIDHWVLPHVVGGGYVAMHDAIQAKWGKGVSQAIDERLSEWEESPPSHSMRIFRRRK